MHTKKSSTPPDYVKIISGASKDVVNNSGETALSIAEKNNQTEIVNALRSGTVECLVSCLEVSVVHAVALSLFYVSEFFSGG